MGQVVSGDVDRGARGDAADHYRRLYANLHGHVAGAGDTGRHETSDCLRHRASGGDALLCIAARYIRPGSYQFLTAAGGGSRDFATVETSKASQHSQNVSAATVSAAQSVAAEGPVAALTMSKQLIVAPADETLFANAVRPRCWKAWR